VAVEVHVVAPEREVWVGDAQMVVARGIDGEVGILRGHAPMLVRLAVGPLTIHRDDDDVVAIVDGGFLHVTSEGGGTRVDVLASRAQLATEIDVEAARAAKAEMERRLSEDRDDAEALRELARANARLELVG
jgi:F-type H+-transporting ATPase subunit epsilon